MSHVEKLQHLFNQCPEGNPLCEIQSTTLLELNHEQIFPSSIEGAYALSDLVLNLDELVRVLDACVETAKEERSRRQAELNSTLIEQDLADGVFRRGKKIKPDSKTRYSPAGGVGDPKVAEWMRNNGYEDVVKEQIHASTFNSVVHEAIKNNNGQLPDELRSLVNSFETYTVSMRKA